jgi:putative mRNA 3-end processing factor
MPDLLTVTDRGLYCEAGDFYIDPLRVVSRAVITHAHSDHAKPGMGKYFCATPGTRVLQARMRKNAVIHPLNYGESYSVNGVNVTLYPAGHILGSAQVRVEHRGEVWVASGDYKLEADATCVPFEPVRCRTFITESTFGIPIYRWRPATEVFSQINAWWQGNQSLGRTSVIYGYSLGKSQRLLNSVDWSIGPIMVHHTILPFIDLYRAEGVALPSVELATADKIAAANGRALVITPPGGSQRELFANMANVAFAEASGWMLLREKKRQRLLKNDLDRPLLDLLEDDEASMCENIDPTVPVRLNESTQGFVLSDHADWPGLVQAIRATGAERILVTHGYCRDLSRWLCRQGFQSTPLGAGEADYEMLAE